MKISKITYNKFNRTLCIDIKGIFREGFTFPYCKDGIIVLDLSILDDPTKSPSYVSKCLTLAKTDERAVTCSKISEELDYHLNGGGVILTGSRSDGSRIKGSDLDLLFISDSKIVMVEMRNFTSRGDYYLADLSSTPPGFTILRSSIDLSFLLSSRPHKTQPKKRQNQFVIHGPSLQFSTEKGLVISDLVSAIQCSNWPPGEKVRWLNRYRRFGWPPKHVVDDLSQTRCVVVQVGSEDSEFSHLEWRFAFPFVERGLVWSFNNTQLQCFVLLKIFNITFLKKIDNVNDDGINTFHIKMVMFWECENSDPKDWCEENLFKCVRRCLHRLRSAIEKKELKHFIIEKRNVLVKKLKNSETREKVLQTIQLIENDISGSLIKCISDKYVPLLLGMIDYQYILNKSQTSLDVDNMMLNWSAWLGTVSFASLEAELLLMQLHLMSLSELHAIRTRISSKTDDLLSEIKSENNSRSESIPYHTMSRFMRNIYLIGNDKARREEIENILLQINRCLIGTIDVQIGSKLFEKATKIHVVEKKEKLSEAEHFFKKGVKMDGLAGQLYLATFYIACGNDKSEKILTTMLKQNGILVCLSDIYFMHNAILISDKNIDVTWGILHDYSQSGYALSISFYNHDIKLVPGVLKYEICMLSKTQSLLLHPFFYAKYLQILLGIKSKSSLVTQYIQELRQFLIPKFYDPSSDYFQCINILAYCYRQIGLKNKANYFYMSSMRCFPKDENCAVFHLAFLLNQTNQSETKAVKQI